MIFSFGWLVSAALAFRNLGWFLTFLLVTNAIRVSYGNWFFAGMQVGQGAIAGAVKACTHDDLQETWACRALASLSPLLVNIDEHRNASGPSVNRRKPAKDLAEARASSDGLMDLMDTIDLHRGIHIKQHNRKLPTLAREVVAVHHRNRHVLEHGIQRLTRERERLMQSLHVYSLQRRGIWACFCDQTARLFQRRICGLGSDETKRQIRAEIVATLLVFNETVTGNMQGAILSRQSVNNFSDERNAMRNLLAEEMKATIYLESQWSWCESLRLCNERRRRIELKKSTLVEVFSIEENISVYTYGIEHDAIASGESYQFAMDMVKNALCDPYFVGAEVFDDVLRVLINNLHSIPLQGMGRSIPPVRPLLLS